MALLKNWLVVQLVLLFSLKLPHFLDALANDYSSVKLYNSWQSDGSTEWWDFDDNSIIRPIVFNNSTKLTFGFGFFSTQISRDLGGEYYLIVFLLTQSLSHDFKLDGGNPPIVVWCANRDSSVSWAASVVYNEGNLELKDIDGTVVWSTNTSGPSSARLNISNRGNLMLVDGKDTIIWQSFDYPTDTWLLNQNISFGKRITSRKSTSDMNTGLYSMTVNRDGFRVYINSDPPQRFIYESYDYLTDLDDSTTIEVYSNNSLSWFNRTESVFEIMRLESTGQLNIYQVQPNSSTLTSLKNIFENLGECNYPLVCGNYGVCSGSSQCSCPGANSSYFTQSKEWEPTRGCSPVTPLSCEDRHLHSFLEVKNVLYFDMETWTSTVDVESCKKACLDNCTCKAAFFSSGQCSLKSQVYSLKYDVWYDSLAFIKVQGIPSKNITQDKNSYRSPLVPVLASTLSVGIVIILVIAAYYYKVLINTRNDEEEEENDQVIGGLKRFSFLELKSATRDFQVRLGRGGFGSVFEGDLCDGTKVAVKRLDSAGQGRKEFLAEVNTIGSTNHFNLVRLIGYCVEKSNRLLVYEHMSNGSLDKWIFNKDRAITLSWEIRRKIIVGLAKGLEYLHMQCNPNIIHFDIKPQNILLDGDFNVKISDFGLAKLIDRDQSQVVTVAKGTPGYWAPELFRGTNISVKADVFSFGIVILEIVFERKNLDSTQSCPLIDIVKEKAENGIMEEDLSDGYNEGIQFPKEESVKMIKIAIWCLQVHNRRPSISTVLKVLEGLVDLESVAEYDFLTSPIMDTPLQANQAVSTNSTPPLASVLSGPR